jgi:uncharacterized protein YbjT (DUF2867 family)
MILVTGASGALGGLIFDRLTSVPGVDVVAGSSSAEGVAGSMEVRASGALGSGSAGAS